MTAGRASRNYAGDLSLTAERIRINSLVNRFPVSWQSRLLAALGRAPTAANVAAWGQRIAPLVEAERGGMRMDATDGDVCQQADITAGDFARRLRHVGAIAAARGAHLVVRLQAFHARHLLTARGLLDLWPAGPKVTRAGAVKRMQCPRFWRRAYRALLARTVEACAVGLGLVRRTAGLYASDDAVQRRAGQSARNAGVLDHVHAVNDHGQDYTLAELAALGTANKVIRRCELLTRIAGFDLIAQDCGHAGVMVTLTCPSRFHKCATIGGGRIVDNRKFDGSTPRQAQQYLSAQWSRCRAAAARAGLDWYGFRIAEPQHDGTPHWHVLLFLPAEQVPTMRDLMRRYFLHADSPTERGAAEHRVRFDLIDRAKGSAVGYVIKYVSKNIDGHGVGYDLEGKPAIESSQRVEAWAATWRVRQFQQIGGAPVTVWRELRRVHPENMGEGAPEALRECLTAVNLAKTEPGVAALAWRRYTAAQGGIGAKRKDMPLRLEREETGECGRYGEVRAPRAVGVRACGWQAFRNHVHRMNPAAAPFRRPLLATVESERAEWLIGQGNRAQAIATAARFFERSGAAASTRIHVNNCTGGPTLTPTLDRLDRSQMTVGRSDFAPRIEHRPKLRRFRSWPAASTPPKGSPCPANSISGTP